MSNKYHNPQLSQRMPQKILDDIEDFAKKRGITRTQAINDAVMFYSHSLECIDCGEINNGKGEYCSCCGSMLFSDEYIKDTLDMLIPYLADKYRFDLNGADVPEVMKKPVEKLQKMVESLDKYVNIGLEPQVEYIIDRSEKRTKYKIRIHLIGKGGVDVLPADTNTYDLDNDIVYAGCYVRATETEKELLKHQKKNKKSK